MDKKNNGGAAFPGNIENYAPQAGMSLRDYFAANALAGRCAIIGDFDETFEAEICYKLADAMLAERAK